MTMELANALVDRLFVLFGVALGAFCVWFFMVRKLKKERDEAREIAARWHFTAEELGEDLGGVDEDDIASWHDDHKIIQGWQNEEDERDRQ